MCGIAGLVGLGYDETVLENMRKTMTRRGPDDSGTAYGSGCVFLHSRLAIVDVAGGAQPMELCCAGECYTLVYNGELYNTRELREELKELGHSFKGHSDTEVVLHAFAQWQEGCLEKFNGIFGFAVWEKVKKRLFLARDRMGVKPLFYSCLPEGLVFASEIKTILAYPGVKRRIDSEGAGQILLFGPGRIPGSGVFQNVRELEPGYYGWYRDGKLQLKQYWKLTDREHKESFEETAEYVRFLVSDAIKRQMVSDVPLGTFLSGGLDSSLISAVCAREQEAPLKTFSVDYENNERYFVPGKFQPDSDNRYIDIMQSYLNSDHHWTVLTPKELSESLEEATFARDLPGMADVDTSLLAFCKRIRKEVKMALSGECADEIFGGYPWYRDPEVRALDGFPWAQNTALRSSFLHPDLRRKINGEEFVSEQYQKTIRESDILPGTSAQERRMKEMVNLNHRWFMQTLLDRKDRMSMYSGLEVRVPFCDYRIAEYLYGVPWEYKDYRGREKGLLRYAMQSYLPQEVLYRKKSPYPKTFDPRYRELMQQRLTALLQQTNAPVWHMVDRTAVERLLQGQDTKPWYGQLMQVPQTMAFILQIQQWLCNFAVEMDW